MNEIITQTFTKKPSDVITLLKAFRSRKSKFISRDVIPEIHVKRFDYQIQASHLKSFNSICKIKPTAGLHIVYPFTIVYPYLMRILCRDEMPFSQFKILNTRNRIILYRTIHCDEKFEIKCYNASARIIPKGLELDFNTELYSDTDKVWENRATYFIPMKLNTTELSYAQPKLQSIENITFSKEWFLDCKNRFKFARVSGDTNGIHYSPFYARMLGFKRDFAQPIRIITQCISKLPNVSPDKPAELDFFLKGPVYYSNILTLKNESSLNANRFDLFCGDNKKPCIIGKIVHINT